MGCCISQEDKEGRVRSEAIENQLRRDRMQMRNEVKMLLLGAGESGKSTILKQMKLIHDGGYSKEEREAFKEIIFSNTVQSMRVILEAMDKMELPLYHEANRNYAIIVMSLPVQIEGEYMPHEVAVAVQNLWLDPNVQQAFQRSREYQLNDSAKYYFDSIDRISKSNYIPTDQDVLRSRVKTTGITETRFVIGDLTYMMFDVGGQRSERKKWIHCFENVTAIVFLVAISEYDQLLFEDETVNRMQEALTLFDSICNSRWFVKTSIILFLNKIDRFKEKLPISPMNKYFEDYEGGDDYDQASQYILNRFVSLNLSDTKQIYAHFTCATDTTQIKFVMAAVSDIIIQTNLRDWSHEFSYAILPHKGTFHEANIVQEAFQFNVASIVRPTSESMTKAFSRGPFFSLEGAKNAVLDSVKRAEDSNAVIIRIYEAYGGRAAFRLKSVFNIASIHRCNILEDDGEVIGYNIQSQSSDLLVLHSFEVMTLKIKLK
ncbi:guanine nucleotide-binding protein subunit alpha [Podila epigama]|nr:guanine nucleotide-binding protein subunit alpha [Podila epigama]